MKHACSLRAASVSVLFFLAAVVLPLLAGPPWQVYESTVMWGGPGSGDGLFATHGG
jgi:hypothetical protein